MVGGVGVGAGLGFGVAHAFQGGDCQKNCWLSFEDLKESPLLDW